MNQIDPKTQNENGQHKLTLPVRSNRILIMLDFTSSILDRVQVARPRLFPSSKPFHSLTMPKNDNNQLRLI